MAVDFKKAARLLWQLPHKSRVFAKVQPASQWGWEESFLNKAVYLLETIVWQNATPSKPAERAKHKSEKPEMYRPDWLPKAEKSDISKGVIAADTDTIKDLLSRPRK